MTAEEISFITDTGNFFTNLLQIYVPRRQCMFGEEHLIWLHIIADFLTAFAYYSIPVGLIYFARRRKDLAYNWMFLLFAFFIVLCGTTHIFGIISIWAPVYRLDGLVKMLTGLISVATAILLWRLMPHALALPSQQEIVRRKDELEALVQQRTTELTETNQALRESEERLKILVEKAEAANVAKSNFLANMSHEIRTPMNVVVGLAHILSVSPGLTPQQKEYVSTLQLSANSLLALINDLLDLSRIEANTLDFEQIPFCMSQLVKEVVNMLDVQVRQKHLQLKTEILCEPDSLFIGDPARTRQIILNLCSNAVKFTDAGSVSVQVKCEDGPHKNQKMVSITVSDTGIGIPPEKIESIFQKFVQADTSINRKYGGTGLGLAITRTLVENMGGTLTVQSMPGKGSEFRAILPLPLAQQADIDRKTLQEQEATKAAQSAKQVRASYRILLVEDHAPNVLVAETYLKEAGYSYDIATNGRQAVEMIKNGGYSAILMDVQMPGMNGFEATRLIREYERAKGGKHRPIIGMTAHALQGDREKCLEAGMDDYLAKPFKQEDLYEKLSVLLHRE